MPNPQNQDAPRQYHISFVRDFSAYNMKSIARSSVSCFACSVVARRSQLSLKYYHKNNTLKFLSVAHYDRYIFISQMAF
jgi:hypothetical protein